MNKLRFYKEIDGRWYVDLPDWTGTKAELEMISGADAMLEYMAEGDNSIWLLLSDYPFINSDVLEYIKPATDIGEGVYYIMRRYKGIDINLNIWLCDVTKFVFGRFPENIYISNL